MLCYYFSVSIATSAIQPPGWKKLFGERPLWLLALLVILFYYQPLFQGATFFYRDLSSHFLPSKMLLIELLKQGEFPLWNPYLQGGQPFLANPNNVVLYPTNILYLLFGPVYGLTLDIVLHTLLCVMGMYLLCRKLGLSASAGFAAAVITGFCGPALSCVNLLNWLLAFSLLPAGLLFWHLYLFENRKRWFVMAALVLVAQILAGAPEFSVFSLLLIAGWTFFYAGSLAMADRARRLALLLIFVAGVSGIQTLPAIQLAHESSRAAKVDYSFFSAWSIPPGRLPELILPEFLGRYDRVTPDAYWGEAVEGDKAPYLLSIYLGIVTLVLTAFGAFLKRGDGPLPPAIRTLLATFVSLALLLATGRYLPGFYNLYRFVPFITFFRIPSKLVMAAVVPVALLAATALDGLADPSAGVSRKKLRFLWFLSTALVVLAFLFWFSPDFSIALEQMFFHRSTVEMHRGLSFAFCYSAFSALLMALLCQARFRGRHWGLVALLTVDLLCAARHVVFVAPPDFYSSVPALVPFVRGQLNGGKLTRTEDGSLNAPVSYPGQDTFWKTRHAFETLAGHLATQYDIPVIFHPDLDGSASLRLLYYQTVLNSLSWERKEPLLAASAVTLVLTGQQINAPGLEPVSSFDSSLSLYRVSNPMLDPAFVSSWIFLDTNRAVMGAMVSPRFDPRRFVVLDGPRSTLSVHDCTNASIKVVAKRVNSSEYDLNNACEGYVVFASPFYPGWRCTVDGHTAPVLRANSIFSAVFVGPGHHTIQRRFVPVSVLAGALLTIISLFVLTALPTRFLAQTPPAKAA